MNTVSILVAFFAGIVSFLAPCVLPIIPGFIGYLAGVSLLSGEKKRRSTVVHSILFVFGFSLVFAALGVLLNTILATVANSTQEWLSRIGGLIIIFFGLYLTGLIHIPFLEQKHGLQVSKTARRSQYITSVLFGAAFAAGWTPCVGIALGAILGLAAAHPGIAFYLLLAYALGLGIPFIIVGFFTAQAQKFFQKLGPAVRIINILFGTLLIIMGILIFTQNLSRIADFSLLNRVLLQ